MNEPSLLKPGISAVYGMYVAILESWRVVKILGARRKKRDF